MSKKKATYQHHLLTYFMDHIPDVIYFKDRKGKLVMVNRSHAKGLNLTPEQVAGKTDFDLFPKKRAERMIKDDLKVMKTGKPIIDKVERATRPDGVDNYVSTTKIPRFDSKGNVIGLMGITRDITHRMQFENLKEKRMHIEKKLEALKELNQIKSEFISTVSHELRTPLAIVKQLIELVFDETIGPLDDKQKEVLAKARNNIDRLKNIIDELLDISRIEGKRLRLHYSVVNLSDLIQESEEFFKRLAAERSIELRYHLPKKEINIFIDAERIVQVISNLIGNAIKFTEENGKIDVEVKIIDDKVRVGIIDTGIGIAKDDLPRLFGKFVQVSRSASDEKKGVGLGLSITKELVERHGGEIWAESSLGVGSKFYFTLPLYYTAKIFKAWLEKSVRDKISRLLHKGIPVYLINLVIVNYDEFKKTLTIKGEKLFEDLQIIIDSVFKEVFDPQNEKPLTVLFDMRKGRCSIILSETTDKKVAEFCERLKSKSKDYFSKNKIDEVFIALGIFSCASKEGVTADEVLNSVNIKEIYIGAELRRYKRIQYQASIDIVFPDHRVGAFQTFDISEKGVCFLSPELLKTDMKVGVRLGLLKKNGLIVTAAQVAWVKEAGGLAEDNGVKYLIGLEFFDLKSQDKKNLHEELRLYYD